MFSLDFRGLLKLRRLSALAKNIVFVPRAYPAPGRRGYPVSEPTDVLPKNLECLEIYVGRDRWEGGYIFPWLAKLHDQRKAFPSLRRIRVLFRFTLPYFQTDFTVMYPAGHAPGINRDLREGLAKDQLVFLEKWKTSDIDLRLFFLKSQGEPVLDRMRAATGDDWYYPYAAPGDDWYPYLTTPETEAKDFHEVQYDNAHGTMP